MKRPFLGYCSVIFLFSLVLGGCSAPIQSPTESSRDFYPNADGNRWVYRLTSLSTSEVSTVIDVRNGSKRTLSSLDVDVTLETTVTGRNTESFEFYEKVTDAGVLFYGSSIAPITEANVNLAFPLQIGKSWRNFGNLNVVAAREQITVPAGTFDAYRVDSSFGSNWYGKNAGPVKSITMDAGGTITSTWELMSKNF